MRGGGSGLGAGGRTLEPSPLSQLASCHPRKVAALCARATEGGRGQYCARRGRRERIGAEAMARINLGTHLLALPHVAP